jgi:hypothetical protein
MYTGDSDNTKRSCHCKYVFATLGFTRGGAHRLGQAGQAPGRPLAWSGRDAEAPGSLGGTLPGALRAGRGEHCEKFWELQPWDDLGWSLAERQRGWLAFVRESCCPASCPGCRVT